MLIPYKLVLTDLPIEIDGKLYKAKVDVILPQTAFRRAIKGLTLEEIIVENDDDTIEDGFGSAWSAVCPECGLRTMSVVRPGKVQCNYCG